MTLDKKYFDEKIHQLYSSEYADVPRIEILIQVARDAAEGQRGKCQCERVIDCDACNCKLEIPE
jgi:hypothetical protein